MSKKAKYKSMRNKARAKAKITLEKMNNVVEPEKDNIITQIIRRNYDYCHFYWCYSIDVSHTNHPILVV